MRHGVMKPIRALVPDRESEGDAFQVTIKRPGQQPVPYPVRGSRLDAALFGIERGGAGASFAFMRLQALHSFAQQEQFERAAGWRA